MRVLLTGAAGFIGSHVHRALIAGDHEVVAVDALLDAVHGPNAEPPDDVSRVDLRDAAALDPLLRGIEVVCHLAAAVPPGSVARAVAAGSAMQRAPVFAEHNDVGTAVLLAAMERAGVRRLVLGSSVSVYGEGCYRGAHAGPPFFPGVRRRADLDRGMFDHRAPRTGEILTWEPVGEDAPLRPRTAYAASKLAQEHYALAWGIGTGAEVTVLRYHHVYGDPVGENAALAAHSGVAARFRAELEAGRAPFVFEDGGQIRDFVHVRDAAAATVAAVRHPLPGFTPLNIASGHPITLWEVASIMSRARGGPAPVVSGQYRMTDVRHLAAHPERAHHTLDFTATIPPTQGLADYATAHAAACT
ncbi:NAD-dependent epimerase/dehydratase family protein [Nocardia terpenica]|uniref:UDP-glucose 4-epimerase n=1 Tax=Nocardia terpenica TaxID=455432 RepID=A0A164I8U3_9NOCA|nr:NAD-dependent epimerase/dehydratase family protein [Nocardia terpenica]KZM69206.1 UDP-glucose 4-epimerase [Nocardia terpenica]MBF6061728.1 NAD-dependent epimerase/dehydratase family protein [Nocardia terpenica]MBF6107477.1 NAD-dependent epimerase/dehydratase family protein [Nocardia terpenica]MBF6110148.1 NAD-dependent epimerase/dehydratase family protein [Nocardia terpenica]MBF6122340.1 NAD-dependent epimerase/dehydratase family protein [Nocardia terpenica]